MTPATDWKETVPDGESARLERLAEQLLGLQRQRAKGKKVVDRGLHAKGQAGVEAEFTVLPELPEHARVGLFAKPGAHRAYVRFSNGAGARQADPKGDVRGIAVKVLGVDGKKVIPGLEGAPTQDFLLIQSPSTPFHDADEFVWFVAAAARPVTLLPRAVWRFGLPRTLRLVRGMAASLSRPVYSVATSRYFSALPIRFGAHAVHYELRPHAQNAADVKRGDGPDYLGDELGRRLANGPVVYDFRLQFFVDETRTPIEDAAKEWLESDAPFVTVARLTLPQQTAASPRGRRVAEFVDKLSFDPWHAQEELRPLGNMMRARNAAYRLSTKERGAAPEPDGSERFD